MIKILIFMAFFTGTRGTIISTLDILLSSAPSLAERIISNYNMEKEGRPMKTIDLADFSVKDSQSGYVVELILNMEKYKCPKVGKCFKHTTVCSARVGLNKGETNPEFYGSNCTGYNFGHFFGYGFDVDIDGSGDEKAADDIDLDSEESIGKAFVVKQHDGTLHEIISDFFPNGANFCKKFHDTSNALVKLYTMFAYWTYIEEFEAKKTTTMLTVITESNPEVLRSNDCYLKVHMNATYCKDEDNVPCEKGKLYTRVCTFDIIIATTNGIPVLKSHKC